MKKPNKMLSISLLLTLALVFMMVAPAISMAAQPTVNLRTTSSFAVLAGSAITNTGPTTINGDAGGDVGLSPADGTSFTGQASVTMSGIKYLADAVALQAKADLVLAYNDAVSRTTDTTIVAALGGGTTLLPGTYTSGSSIQINGTLTLDAQGDPNAVFVFQAGSTLTTANASEIKLINGARYCRIFWQVGSSATLGTDSIFKGHIFAMDSITANTRATVQGQLLARNGAVTLDTNTITNGICATLPTTATLHVIKNVINDNGRTAVAADFNLHVKTAGIEVAASPAPGAVAPGTTYTLAAGTYVVSEDANALYTASFSGDSTDGNITLAAGATKTVTITNNDIPLPTTATLHVIKNVINDNGRTAVAADFNLHVKTAGIEVAASPAPGAVAPGTTYTLAAGTYVVSEDANALYTASFSGDSTDGNITLAAGATKTVTITNNDIPLPPIISDSSGGESYPPLINVIKTPLPLALTSGQGLVTYTYKVTNPGMVTLNNVSLTDNKISAVNYVSGDVNTDNRLQVNETWTYTGSMNLTATTTNTATAKGSANGMTATDIAFATVVVTTTVPVYPPLINVIKTPLPLALTSGQGLVTYTYKVTNPGMVTLSNVSLTDDKISAVNYVSGDINADNLLQTSETWTYTSNMNLTVTTTNTATAKGSANGMTATDLAFATVVVTPVTTTVNGGQIPKTGTPLYELLLVGVSLTLVGAGGWRSRKRYE